MLFHIYGSVSYGHKICIYVAIVTVITEAWFAVKYGKLLICGYTIPLIYPVNRFPSEAILLK